MIHDIQEHGETVTGTAPRVLAVVSGQKAKAQEVAACFARQGDAVRAMWYPDADRLLAAKKRKPQWEAVILFAAKDPVAGDREEAAVRLAFQDTPLYRL